MKEHGQKEKVMLTDEELWTVVVNCWDGSTAYCLCCHRAMQQAGPQTLRCACGQEEHFDPVFGHTSTILPRMYPSEMPDARMRNACRQWRLIEGAAARNALVILGLIGRAERDRWVAEAASKIAQAAEPEGAAARPRSWCPGWIARRRRS